MLALAVPTAATAAVTSYSGKLTGVPDSTFESESLGDCHSAKVPWKAYAE